MSDVFQVGWQEFEDSTSAHREIAYRWMDTQCAGALDLRASFFSSKSDDALAAQCIDDLKAHGEHLPWLNQRALTAAFGYQREAEVIHAACIWLASRIKDGDSRSIGQPLIEALYAQRRETFSAAVNEAIAQRAITAAKHVGQWWAGMVREFGSHCNLVAMAERAFRANPDADVAKRSMDDGRRVCCAMVDGLYVEASERSCVIYRAPARSVADCRDAVATQDKSGDHLLVEWTTDAAGQPVDVTEDVKVGLATPKHAPDLEQNPQPTWSREDDAEAEKEGWNLFSVDDGRLEIQRIDEYDVFETDDAALAFIRERAAGGSALHQKALDLDRGAQQGLAENDAPPVEFRVRWEIDLDAASPRDAAEQAWDVQKDPQTLPPVFEVVDRRSGIVHSIDLEDTQQKPRSRRNSMTF